MINKIVNYSHQSIDAHDLRAVSKTIKSGILTQGKEVKNFENNLKKYFSSKYASTVSSGTAALHLTSNALGWKKNDFIVITAGLPFGKAGMTNMIRLYKVGT